MKTQTAQEMLGLIFESVVAGEELARVELDRVPRPKWAEIAPRRVREIEPPSDLRGIKYDAVVATYKDWVSDLTAESYAETIRRSESVITQAISEGWHLYPTGWDKDQGTYTVPGMLDELAKEFGQIETYKLERKAITEHTRAVNLGAVAGYRDDPAVWAVRYVAIMDTRTSDICQMLNGAVMAVDDPRMGTFIPPRHVNCRSVVVPVFVWDRAEINVDTSRRITLERRVTFKKEDGSTGERVLKESFTYAPAQVRTRMLGPSIGHRALDITQGPHAGWRNPTRIEAVARAKQRIKAAREGGMMVRGRDGSGYKSNRSMRVLSDLENQGHSFLSSAGGEPYVLDKDGLPCVRYYKPRYRKVNRRQKLVDFGDAVWLDHRAPLATDAARDIVDRVKMLADVADEMGIPRLRGVNVAPLETIGRMGDGILDLDVFYLNNHVYRGRLSKSLWTPRDEPRWRPEFPFSVFSLPHERTSTIIEHEFAHHIHQQLGVRMPQDYFAPPLETKSRMWYNKLRERSLSNLPTLNSDVHADEWFADCWSLWRMGRSDLVPQSMVSRLEFIRKGVLPL